MNKYFLFMIIFINNIFLSAGSITDSPTNPIKLEKLILSDKENYQIMLPYKKPEGIDKIYTADFKGILVCQIIGDGKVINPQKKLTWFAADDTIIFRHETDIDITEMNLDFRMVWKTILGGKNIEETLKKGLLFETYKGSKSIPYKYTIPYKTKEIYITYRILFPNLKETEASEIQTVYFEIDWP